MLENCATQKIRKTVFRLTATPKEPLPATLLKRGISLWNINPAIAALFKIKTSLTAEETIDDAFRKRDEIIHPFPIGRFGDGSIGVYYSALEKITCQRELEFHISDKLAKMRDNAFVHPRFYSLIGCDYSGVTVDLCGLENLHPDLVSDTKEGYPFCQRLGHQAINLDIDGIYNTIRSQ